MCENALSCSCEVTPEAHDGHCFVHLSWNIFHIGLKFKVSESRDGGTRCIKTGCLFLVGKACQQAKQDINVERIF